MKEFLQEAMSENLSWATDPKYRAAIKISEAAVFLIAGISELLIYFYGGGTQLNVLIAFSTIVLIAAAFCRYLISANYLFALKVWTAYVMKVHLPIPAKITLYTLVISAPLVANNPDMFMSTLWLLISGIDFNMRSISNRNLKINPRD